MLTLEKTHELPLQEYLRDIANIDPNEDYTKQFLAEQWGFDRRTINRWQNLAIDYAPLFNLAFDFIYHYADCPACGSSFRITEIDNRKLKRGWSISCPKCLTKTHMVSKTEVGTNSGMKIPGQHAKVLRFIGIMVASFGNDKTIKLLTTAPEGKEARKFIRNLLQYH